MKTPTVSVLMSVYNAERFLPGAIRSILNQTFTDFEFIIIDDGSSDSSGGVIEGFNDPRIRLITQENAGLARALNRGLAEARGTLVARMDADDISLPQRLAHQIDYLETHPEVVLLGTAFEIVDESETVLGAFYPVTRDSDIRREAYLRNPFGHGTVVFRRTAIQQLGGYPETTIEDYALWKRVMESHPVANLPETLYRWRVSPAGMSQGASDERQRPIRELSEAIWRDLPFRELSTTELRRSASEYTRLGPEFFEQFLYDQYGLVLLLWHKGRYALALRTMIAAFLLAPRKVGLLQKIYRNRGARNFNLGLITRAPVRR